jgi:arylsulfatase A-like enzyme
MKKNGYRTARFGKNDYGGSSLHRHNVREYPLNHGFDEFLGFSAHGHDFFLLSKDIQKRTPDPKGHSAVVGPLMHNRGVKEFKDGYLTEIFTDATIDFLKRHRKESFFVTLSYNSVHHLIHQSPERYLDKYGVKKIPNYDPNKDGSYAMWFQQYIRVLVGNLTGEAQTVLLRGLSGKPVAIQVLGATERHMLPELSISLPPYGIARIDRVVD